MKTFSFYHNVTIHKKQHIATFPHPMAELNLLVLMVKSRAEVLGLDNSREHSCEHIQEGDQAFSHRGRCKKPQQRL